MEKRIKHTYKGLNQDVTKSKTSNEYYFDAKNIRLTPSDSQITGSLANEKGNSLKITIPTPVIDYDGKIITYNSTSLSYTNDEIDYSTQSSTQYIIAQRETRDGIVIITTDNNGFDCIWSIDLDTFNITLLYLRNMGLSTDYPIEILNNFENTIIDKIYWVDGNNQIRFINLKHSLENGDLEELIDLPLTVIDMVPKYNFSQPVITNVVSGGTHTSGMIQYAYNLYRLNSSQTKISPLSELTSLDTGVKGGDLNEVVGATPIVKITDIDSNYTHMKVYAIKYTSYNETPSINLIDDSEIPSSQEVIIYDDGINISSLSLEEFIYLGSDIIIPQHISNKYNRLLIANYKEIDFDITIDTRAYSFMESSSSETSNRARVYKNLTTYVESVTKTYYPYTVEEVDTPTGDYYDLIYDDGVIDYDTDDLVEHDSVNLDYDTYRYQVDGLTEGGEGKYIKYELTTSTTFNEDNKYFKDDEIYRIGIEFYNTYGQVSLPSWIADFRAPSGNLLGNYNTLSVTLKDEFFTWLSTNTFDSEYDIPVGYKILVAERTYNDKTIVANGLVSPMMLDWKADEDEINSTTVKLKADDLLKYPNILMRNYNKTSTYGITQPLRKATHLDEMSITKRSSNTEMPRAYYGDVDTAGRCYQFNSMLQLYSPELLFNVTTPITEGLKFKVKGSIKNTTNNSWGRIWNTSTTLVAGEHTVTGAISPVYGGTLATIVDHEQHAWYYGLVSQPIGSIVTKANHIMYDRVYGGTTSSDINNGSYVPAPKEVYYGIYGKPELTEKGQSATNYNDDPNYRYINSFKGIYTDGDTGWDNDGTYGRKIISINSYGNNCLTFVPGDNDNTVEHYNRPKMEVLGAFANITGDDNGLIVEIVKPDNEIYLGNIYGGNSYEDKKRTNYLEIGTYNTFDSTSPTVTIDSPGDTFVNFFKYARVVRTDTDIISEGTYVLEELVTVLCETTVDLKNRNDLSTNEWDARFQPYDSEYHSYNKVYSQQPTLTLSRDLNYNIKKFSYFDTNVISTSVKSSGELIDSWTNLSTNDVLTLDGKYGSITSLTSFKDEIYALQERAVAYISIQPRVQVQGGDGLAIELGTGDVLDRYKYISTTFGTFNKWSVTSSPNAFYFYDLLNKSIMMFNGGLIKLSDTKGLHSFFKNNTIDTNLKIDNHLLGDGIIGGYDTMNNELFMTFHQSDGESFTISYNEYMNEFISFYDYIPSLYISKGDSFLTIPSDNNTIYKQYDGEYNNFYGITYPTTITINSNPDADLDCIFNNLEYKSEVYLNGVDQFDKTLTGVRLYNEYQDSGLVTLTVGRNSNVRRKFRDWNVVLPRNANTRERIRNPWVKLMLQFDNTSNYKLILHDVIISYTV